MLTLLWQDLYEQGDGAGGAGASQEARQALREGRGELIKDYCVGWKLFWSVAAALPASWLRMMPNLTYCTSQVIPLWQKQEKLYL